MTTPEHSTLGRRVGYPRDYDPGLLFAIARAPARAQLGLSDAPPISGLPFSGLPFIGVDRWHAYELGWLDARGKPCVATATIAVPATSPALIESKSLKLYLNSFNATRFESADAVRARIAADLAHCAGAPVQFGFGLPAIAAHDNGMLDDGMLIDGLDIAIDAYGPPDPAQLRVAADDVVEETLRSELLKSNCPVTGQPDWASVRIAYRGPRIDRAGLLRYLVSFREHGDFHEQCVERMFVDLLAHCRPASLAVEARYTRRGGLDINPWRATPDRSAPAWARDARQ